MQAPLLLALGTKGKKNQPMICWDLANSGRCYGQNRDGCAGKRPLPGQREETALQPASPQSKGVPCSLASPQSKGVSQAPGTGGGAGAAPGGGRHPRPFTPAPHRDAAGTMLPRRPGLHPAAPPAGTGTGTAPVPATAPSRPRAAAGLRGGTDSRGRPPLPQPARRPAASPAAPHSPSSVSQQSHSQVHPQTCTQMSNSVALQDPQPSIQPQIPESQHPHSPAPLQPGSPAVPQPYRPAAPQPTIQRGIQAVLQPQSSLCSSASLQPHTKRLSIPAQGVQQARLAQCCCAWV